MRAVLQCVTRASVTVDGARVGSIGAGLLVLLGVAAGDGQAEAQRLAEKTAGLRIFPSNALGAGSDTEGKFNLSLAEAGGAALVVSQFTLLADTRKGRRPSFTAAAPPNERRSSSMPSSRRYGNAACSSRRAASARTCWSSWRTTAP